MWFLLEQVFKKRYYRLFDIRVDGYSDAHITFKWETTNGMEFVASNLQMHPQYVLAGMELSQSFTMYVAGKYIRAWLTLQKVCC